MTDTAQRRLKRVGLVLGGLFAGLLVAEVVLRVADVARGNDLVFMGPQSYPLDLYVKDGDMAYANPAFAGTVSSYGYSTQPRFNRWGTRGPEPKAGVPTWIAVGDSFTMALQVEEEETYVSLAATAAGAQPINAGIDGYSTWQAAIRTVQLGRNFPPSLVVLSFFTGNDFFDNQRQPRGRSVDQPGLGQGEPGAPAYGVPNPGMVPYRNDAFLWIRSQSVLVASIDVWQKTRRLRSPRDGTARRFRDELALFTDEGRMKLERETAQTRSALQAFRAATAKVNAANLVVVIPPAFTMDEATATKTFSSVGLTAKPQLDRAQAAAVLAAKEAGLRVCDVMADLRAAHQAGQEPYLLLDGHLSPAGHKVVAAAIGRCLSQ